MGWEGTKLLTNGEHDDLWRKAYMAIPGVAASLRRSNAIECLKILHGAGKMTDDDFYQSIEFILKAEGFTWTK